MYSVATNPETGLRRRKQSLESQLRELVGPSPQIELLQVEPFADPADQIAWNAGREIAAQQLDSEAHWIHDIRLALDKIQNGGYGKCDGCEEPIGQRRLDALPWARFCVACQSALEAGANRKMVAFDRAA